MRVDLVLSKQTNVFEKDISIPKSLNQNKKIEIELFQNVKRYKIIYFNFPLFFMAMAMGVIFIKKKISNLLY